MSNQPVYSSSCTRTPFFLPLQPSFRTGPHTASSSKHAENSRDGSTCYVTSCKISPGNNALPLDRKLSTQVGTSPVYCRHDEVEWESDHPVFRCFWPVVTLKGTRQEIVSKPRKPTRDKINSKWSRKRWWWWWWWYLFKGFPNRD